MSGDGIKKLTPCDIRGECRFFRWQATETNFASFYCVECGKVTDKAIAAPDYQLHDLWEWRQFEHYTET